VSLEFFQRPCLFRVRSWRDKKMISIRYYSGLYTTTGFLYFFLGGIDRIFNIRLMQL
jgi:hypothetical protein